MDASIATNPVMMICPNLKCRKVLQVSGRFRGRQVKCHYCGTTFSVPAAKTESDGEEKKEKKGS